MSVLVPVLVTTITMSSPIPSDSELVAATNEVLKDCDLEVTTLKTLRKKLEKHFKCGDLSSRKDVIRDTLEIFMGLGEEEEELEEEDLAAVDSKKTMKKGGFGKAVQLSDDLSEFLGHDILPRTEVTKKIWVYIKEHDLQNPADRREILCDEKLQKLFKKKAVNMFKMTKYLSVMMKSMDDLGEFPDEAAVAAKEAAKKRKVAPPIDKKKAAAKKKAKTAKTKSEKSEGGEEKPKAVNGLQKPKAINADLAKVLSCTVVESRVNIVKYMWAYIKGKDLQNPKDRREIVLDPALKSVFKVDTLTIMSMNKALSDHISDL